MIEQADKPKKRGKKPGSPKSGGRAAGTPNKKTTALIEMVQATGFDPVQALCKLGLDAQKDGDNDMAYTCAKELLPYMYPKRKALAVTGDGDGPAVSFNINTGAPLALSESLQLIADAAPNDDVLEHV